MSNYFQMKILTGENCMANYNAIQTKDPLTFYLLQNGKGFLGTTQLFGQEIEDSVHLLDTPGDKTSQIQDGKVYAVIVDGVTVGVDSNSNPVPYQQGMYLGKIISGSTILENFSYKSISQYIAERAVRSLFTDDGNGNQTIQGVAGSNTEIPTTKALVDYVQAAISGQSILQAQFFKNVEPYTVTATDIAGTTATPVYADLITPTNQFADAHAGDIGLIFTRDAVGSDTNNDDVHIFVNLHDLLQMYDVVDSNSIDLTLTNKAGSNHTKEIKADIKLKNGETSLQIDNVNGGVYLKKTVVTESNGEVTDSGIATSLSTARDDVLVTEKSLLKLLEQYVKYQVVTTVEGSGENATGSPDNPPDIP